MHFNTEGDINQSPERQKWYESLSEETKSILGRDAAIFMKQSMSTPCLDVVISASRSSLMTFDGRSLIDFHGNSLHQVGHMNDDVIHYIHHQMTILPFIPRRFTAEVAIEAAEALVDKTTSKDYKVLFIPSGSAAVGLALKIARRYTKHYKVISMWESFHGAGLDTISVGGEYVFKKDMGPMIPGSIKVMPYNAYRNVFQMYEPEILARRCLDYLEDVIVNEGEIGALLMEPVRATDIHVPPKMYFEGIKALCDRYGILLIFDEIPTGIGRSGEFYVHQNFGIEPDILVLGKGLGGGIIPQAAVLCRSYLDVASDISLGHYTHEKPALGSAAILGMFKYLKEHDVLSAVKKKSALIKKQADELKETFECIGDVRQLGFLISFEIVSDVVGRTKDETMAEKLLYECIRNGLSFKIGSGNCITWHLPLITTEDEIREAFRILREALNRRLTL